MTSTEETKLRAMGEELADAMQNPWEPLCLSRAFATPLASAGLFTLTMQGWIDLDAARSVVLQGQSPSTQEEFEAALRAFGYHGAELTPPEAVVMTDEMVAAVVHGFSTALRMVPPGAQGTDARDGFGDWLPLLNVLMADLHCSRLEALECPVNQAFALTAALRRDQGWTVGGVAYALRDISLPSDAAPDPQF